MSKFQKLSTGVSRSATIQGTDIGSGAATSTQFLAANGSGSSAFRVLAAGDLPTITLTGVITGSASGGSIATSTGSQTGTGSTFVMSVAPSITGAWKLTDAGTIVNATTATKVLAFDLSGASASTTLTLADTQSTTQTLTIPNITSADTLAVLSLAQTFTNKSFIDSSTFFLSNSDTSRRMKFDLTNITSSTTRTLTVQDASGTIAVLGTNQTFSGAMTLSAAGTALTVNNNAVIGGNAAVNSTSLDAASLLVINGTSTIAGTSSVGVKSAYTSAAAQTSQVEAFLAALTTAASTTVANVYNYRSSAPALGASGTITRFTAFSDGGSASHAATNNAWGADNNSYTGNWFINQSGTDPSTFGGTISSTAAGNDTFGTASNSATLLVSNNNQGNALQGRTLTAATSNTTHQQAPFIVTQAEIWNGTTSVAENIGFTNYGVSGTNSAYYGSFESSSLTQLITFRGDVRAVGIGTLPVSGTALTVGGNLTSTGAFSTQGYDTSAATSGTITASANTPGLSITGAGGTTLTIKLPSSPIDGQQYWVASQGAFTTVTWQDSGGTAGNVIGGQAAIGGTNRGQRFVYSTALTKWIAVS